MAVTFSKSWSDEIAETSTQADYQTCQIRIVDPNEVRYPGPNYPTDPTDLTRSGYDWETNAQLNPVFSGEVYSGQARFIPIRAGVFTGGESQVNASTIRAVRFQLPHGAGPKYIRKGLTIQFTAVPKNPSLEGRWATVTDDFQGASSAARTINASMDIDAGDG